MLLIKAVKLEKRAWDEAAWELAYYGGPTQWAYLPGIARALAEKHDMSGITG